MQEQLINDAKARMQKSIEALHAELTKLRTGRATPSMLEHIHVNYYGAPTPLSQVANITALDARTLSISPWEKSLIKDIEKAILTSDLGLNPSTSGDGIRVPLPPLTEERRRELTKVVKSEVENAKIAVRNIRRDVNASLKELVKNKEITEDDERRSHDRVQKVTDEIVAEMDKICQRKETELMEI
jgi:ribosome recycling factor